MSTLELFDFTGDHAYLIPAEGPPEQVPWPEDQHPTSGFPHDDAKAFIRGLVETISSPDGTIMMLLDEEGKIKGKQVVNVLATEIALEYRMMAPTDYIVGDAIVLVGNARWLPGRD